MRNWFRGEIVILVLILILLGWSFKPLAMPMNAMAEMAIGSTLVILFVLLAGFLLNEQASDEREAAHRALADRIGFLTGAGALVILAAVESFQHEVEAWVIGVLGIMILSKMIGLWYVHIKK